MTVAILALVVLFGGVGVPLLVIVYYRQRAILDRLENLLLEIETETRATAHKVGVDLDVVAASVPVERRSEDR